VQNKNHLTPLHLASFYGWVELVRILLERGATTHSEDNLGRTPLHLVAKGNSDIGHDGVGVAQLLLEHGADINSQDKQNTTPLHLSSYRGKVEIARVLLDRGANASAKDATGRTPLHMVSRSAYSFREDGAGIAKLLLEHGVDINAQDSSGATPLDFALHHGRLDIASLLLHYGAIRVTTRTRRPDLMRNRPYQLGSKGVHLYDKPAPST
jgi:ankyrin repeat protein